MRKTIYAAMLGGAACAAALSRARPRLQLHECDWRPYEEGSARRSYLSLSHFLYHLRELAAVQRALAEVYLARALPPALRESIMLVTAMANECTW